MFYGRARTQMPEALSGSGQCGLGRGKTFVDTGIVYLLIHGFIGEGYEALSVWLSYADALRAQEAYRAGTQGWRYSATGLLEREVERGRRREYLDVIPRQLLRACVEEKEKHAHG